MIGERNIIKAIISALSKFNSWDIYKFTQIELWFNKHGGLPKIKAITDLVTAFINPAGSD